jgi:peroxiredoxin
MRFHGLVTTAYLLLTLVLLTVTSLASAENSTNPPPAPAFELTDLEGNKINLSQYQGEIVVLNFWGTFCAPCVKETPELVAMQLKFANQGLIIIGAAMDKNNDAAVKAFAKKFFVNYPIVIAPSSLTNDYGIVVAPTTFIIDKKGTIAFRHVGLLSRKELEQQITPLL